MLALIVIAVMLDSVKLLQDTVYVIVVILDMLVK